MMGTLGGFPNPPAMGSGGGPAYARRVLGCDGFSHLPRAAGWRRVPHRIMAAARPREPAAHRAPRVGTPGRRWAARPRAREARRLRAQAAPLAPPAPGALPG